MDQFRRNLHNFANKEILVASFNRMHLTIFFMWFFVGLALLLTACSEPVDDEVRIRQRVAEMVSAAEAKELGDVLEPVHEDFLGNKRIRRVNLKGLVLLHFRRNKNVHVFVNDLEVELKGGEANVREAKVTCNVVMAGRNQTLPEHARVLQVTSVWKKIEDDWFVVSASWKDPLLGL